MIYLLLRVASSVVAVVALPLLLPQSRRPASANKSPGPPKLAFIVCFVGITLFRLPRITTVRLKKIRREAIASGFSEVER